MPELAGTKQCVLFLSTRNAARSLIAEAWLRKLAGDRFDVQSAGTSPAANVDPLVVQVMSEAGVDMSSARPRSIANMRGSDFDIVVILCPREGEVEPSLPDVAQQVRWSFEDPAQIRSDSHEQRLRLMRRLRDELLTRVMLFVNATVPGVPQR